MQNHEITQGLIDDTWGGLLEKWARETPQQEFMVYADRGLRFTYKEFNERVDNVAKGLLSLGVGKGDKVGIWAKNVPDWLTFMFATAKIGGVYVTVNPNYKLSELKYIMQNSDMHTLCLVNGYRDSDYVQMIYELVPELKTQQRGKLRAAEFPELRNIVYVGQEKQRGMYNTAEIILLGSYVDDSLLDQAKSQVGCHDVMNMQYTSGTTGFPKGVLLTSHNIVNNGMFIGIRMEYTAADKVCVCVPLFHCFGSVLGISALLTHGATAVMVEDFDPLKVLASVHKERCTVLHGVPTMFIAELNHPMFEMFDLTSLRTGIMAGALCPIALMNAVMEKMNLRVISVYGLTETSPGMTVSSIRDTVERRATTVGTALPFVEVKIVDPATGETCPPHVNGEICCRGYNVMQGYYNNPEATAEVIDKDGFLHSGDLAQVDEDGYYQITGRIKEMIIRGGENIYPREIENFLRNMEEIENVEIVGLPSPKYGEIVGAFVKIKSGKSLTEEEITLYCRGNIARYKIPKHIFFVDEFPMTASGKIQKYKLKEIGLRRLEEVGVEIV